MHVVDYFVENIHIFYTLLINYVPKFHPRISLVGGYQPVHWNLRGNRQSTCLLAWMYAFLAERGGDFDNDDSKGVKNDDKYKDVNKIYNWGGA